MSNCVVKRCASWRARFARASLCLVVCLLSASRVVYAQDSQTPAGVDRVQDAKIPYGSYQLTCLIADLDANNLHALCATSDGNWLESTLHAPDRCETDISNVEGQLTCDPNVQALPVEFQPAQPADSNLLAPMLAAHWRLEHETWTFKDGAPQAYALARTNDGFLWIGGPSGLYRFDGRRFELFHSPFGEQLPSTPVRALYAPRAGGLWIGYYFGGASFLYQGRVRNYGEEVAATSGSITGFIQDKDDGLWATGTTGLWRFDQIHWERVGTEWDLPIKGIPQVAVDRDGNLWVGDGGKLFRLPRGGRHFQLVQQNLGNNRGMAPLVSERPWQVDAEGNIWLGGLKGLDRFYYTPLAKVQYPDLHYPMTIAADSEDARKIWLGGPGLYRTEGTKAEPLLEDPESFFVQFFLRASDDTLWVGSNSGLWHQTGSRMPPSRNPDEQDLVFDLRKALWKATDRSWEFVALPPEVADKAPFLQAITQDRRGGIWVSLGRHGLYRLADGVWTSKGGHNDLRTGVVSEFTDGLGRVWFGYLRSELAVLDGDNVRVFGRSDGLHVGNITAIQGHGPHVWIGGEFGIQQFDSGTFKSISAADNDLLRGISGIIETSDGDLWLNGFSGIFHIRRSELAMGLKDQAYRVKGEQFGRQSGLATPATHIRPLPSAFEGTDGRLWFSTTSDVFWLDPAHSAHPAVSPPITIQSVSADGKFYPSDHPYTFPAHTSDVQIGYAAVNLSDPDAVHFRYELEEIDADWHEATLATPVTYRNLAPGHYHFRASATNANGDWTDAVARAEFTILPAFYQTGWFISIIVLLAALLLWLTFSWRLARAKAQMRALLDERVTERERIARELHDTFLQGVQGLMLRFQSAMERIPTSQPARELMESALDHADAVIAEGRDRVSQLRTMQQAASDLPNALQALGESLVRDAHAKFELTVEGVRSPLNPVVSDEIQSIAREALVNATRHAQAKQIDVTVTYGRSILTVNIVDDGVGFDAEAVTKRGPSGHWGLKGMRERAGKLHAHVKLSSRPGAGTAVELTVPAAVAFGRAARDWRRWLGPLGAALGVGKAAGRHSQEDQGSQ